ncbi:MAG: DUF4340 domain-containing protein [Armatimonadota bacterium]
MRWRSTIAAALLFVALLAWVLTKERYRVPQEGEVFGLDIAQVTGLRIEREGEETIVLEKRGDDWFITQPFQGLASNDEAERMVKAIAELKPTSTREGQNLDAEQFGLAQAPLVATLIYDGGKQATVYVGAETPMGSERYAKVSGARTRGGDAKLYVVSSMLRTTLWKEPDQLREKQVARFEADEVTSVTLSHGSENVVATRSAAAENQDDEVKWALTTPLQTAADEWTVKQLINNVRDLRAEDFLTEAKPDAELGFSQPQARVSLKLADGRVVTITFGKSAEVEVGDPPAKKQIVYTGSSEREEVLLVSADVLDKVRKTAFDLRDKSVLRFARDDVQRITVERTKGLSFTVARRPDGWRVEKPQSFDARQGAIDDILWDLEDLSAVKFVKENTQPSELRAYGLAVPQTAITIYLKGRDPIKVLIGAETSEGNYYCKTSESGQVVEISEFLMGDLPESVEDLKQTTTESETGEGDDTGGS